ncbi:phosphatidylinositol-glycan biosynthesis class W protein [Corythoichthys intestinalis]|uniref:phosphatidylinositol-glycan biosynthesis class W protein n=1 Tax=Corythoichthys intestinalis TaxID=161448 RepID=UPI0025A4F692|nr:phosphatidylinositol-glycan biosynthesis class W protein [Corythoichthys intestinalis]XP_061801013.1 phosphatidylinositol-glycan biosynthesis class W protein-like [Nerophis lumbriciformis]
MSQKELKEAFVSNLNGTSLQEVVVGSFLTPLCILSRALILISYHQAKGNLPLPFPRISHLLLDFTVLVLPLVLSCTVLSNYLFQVVLSASFVVLLVLYHIYRRKRPTSLSSFFNRTVHFKQLPFVTIFRVMVNVQTAISILAVDFRIFPRRYAKTETFGTGVMDFGVGAFIFANGLVCPEARGRNVLGSKIKHIFYHLLYVWPLVALGVLRLALVKMRDYQEHVTEYGVHWNFFFTLAIVRVMTKMLLVAVPAKHSWILALVISSVYQFALETTGLKDFILYNNDREKSFLHANKEGIFSTVGYVAIYMAGVQVGCYVMQPRSHVRHWFKAIFNLLIGSITLFVVLYTCQILVEPVSRRLANLPFCLWSVALSLLFVSCIGFVDLIVLFYKTISGCHFVPTSWNSFSSTHKKKDETEALCLIQAVDKNQMLFFLVANIFTMLTNIFVDTLGCGSLFSIFFLLLYMFGNCLVICLFSFFGIRVRF